MYAHTKLRFHHSGNQQIANFHTLNASLTLISCPFTILSPFIQETLINYIESLVTITF